MISKLNKYLVISFVSILSINAISYSKELDKSNSSSIKNEYEQIKNYADKIFESEIKNNQSIGISVGIIKGKDKYYFNYGFTDKKNKIKPSEKTIFGIASATKVFTTTLLADMILNDSVKLSDGLSKYLPESIKSITFNTQEINLLSLATHTSGLPNEPLDIDKFNFKPEERYANYKEDNLYNYLSKFKLSQDDKNHTGFGYYSYSNLGMGILGHILSKKLNLTYENAILNRICKPLGLKNTVITLNEEQDKSLATGYLKYNGEDIAMPISGSNTTDIMAGSFALKSNVEDLLTFVDANLGNLDINLKPSIDLAQKEIYPNLISLGWHLNNTSKKEKIIWHNGTWTLTGFSSFIGFVKDKNLGVVILYNTSDLSKLGQNVTQNGFKVLDKL
jgi:D-alanyl-D-alanine-carboxypeptidase/D-alanyl-D-alanine-endopeptidase